MVNLIILILLTGILFIYIRRLSGITYLELQNDIQHLENSYEKLASENSALKNENRQLKDSCEETIALYDITKEICKTLDPDKVFNYFAQEINRYIRSSDCKFLQKEEELIQYQDYKVLPLNIEKKTIGYLVARGVKEEDNEKFQILTNQFLLGLRRAVLYQKVQELAITDSLTGVFSRRYYLERFQEEIVRSQKFKYNFSCLMIDVDHFKEYNDHYGHLVGDALLREVARTIKEIMRQIDLIGRYGGEEFSVILTETDKEQARFAAERIRKTVEDKCIRVYDEEFKVTVSIGISMFPNDARNLQALLVCSDTALYQAKESGRNRVCIYKQ